MNPFASNKAPIKKELKNIIDEVNISIIHFFTIIIIDSCKMSQIWQIYLCKKIDELG